MNGSCSYSISARSFVKGRPQILRGSYRRIAEIGAQSPPRSHTRRDRNKEAPSTFIVRASEETGEKTTDEDIQEVVEAKSIIEGNAQFASVFKSALQRRGKEELRRNTRPIDENKPSPAEQVLLEGLRQSRRNILRLEELQKVLENAKEVENKQFERIQFALKRATADAAFIKTLQKLRAESQAREAAQEEAHE